MNRPPTRLKSARTSRFTLLATLTILIAVASSGLASGANRSTPSARHDAANTNLIEGRPAEARAIFRALADEYPAWIPAHTGLAMSAVAQGGDAADEMREQMRRRRRRSSRDVGASLAHAVLLIEAGRRDAALDALESAIIAGARGPTLADWLLRADPAGQDAAGWLARRVAVLPGDSRLASTLAEVLLSAGRLADARQAVERALRRGEPTRDLLLIEVVLLGIAGRETDACLRADHALGLPPDRSGTREVTARRRLRIARAQIACGDLASARRAIASVSTSSPPLSPEIDLETTLVRAELDLAGGNPFAAHDALPDDVEGMVPRLVGRLDALRLASDALLGRPGRPEATARAIERLLADDAPRRGHPSDLGVALSALTLLWPDDARLAPRIDRLAATLAREGMPIAAARLRPLADALEGSSPDRSDLPEDVSVTTRASIRAAERIAQRMAGRGNGLSRDELAGAHGAILAPLRTLAALDASRGGEVDAAHDLARSALLDLQEADRSGAPLPAPLRALARHAAGERELSATLVEILLLDRSPDDASPVDLPISAEKVSDLVEAFARQAGAWSAAPGAWREGLADAAARLPERDCLVLAPGGSLDLAIAWKGSEVAFVGKSPDVLAHEACRDARVVYWMGLAPPEGLTTDRNGERVLARLTGPVAPSPEELLGRPFRGVSGSGDGEPITARPRVFDVHFGRGSLLSREPLASGWLVNGEPPDLPAFVGAADVPGLLGSADRGFMALGLEISPRSGSETGSWLLAESILSVRPWAVLSRAPQDAEAVAEIVAREGAWRSGPASGARTVAARHPETARELSLWVSLDRIPIERGPKRTSGARWALYLGVLIGIALLAAGAIRFARRRVRSGSRSR